MKAMTWVFFTLLLLMPASSYACSVCFTGREGFMEAFYATTLLLMLAPPVILGTIGFFFWKAYKKAKAAQEQEQAS